jgi:hypothetical protein
MLVALGRHDSFKVPSYELDAPGLEMTASRFPAMNIEFWSCLFYTHTQGRDCSKKVFCDCFVLVATFFLERAIGTVLIKQKESFTN